MLPEKRLLSVLIGCLMLTGCGGQRMGKKNYKQGQQESADLALFKAFHELEVNAEQNNEAHKASDPIIPEHLEARLHDIPIPLKSSWCSENSDPNTLAFISELNSETLCTFYLREMDRLGWNQEIIFNGHEPLLIFRKPDRWLALSIRIHQNSYWNNQESYRVVIQQAS